MPMFQREPSGLRAAGDDLAADLEEERAEAGLEERVSSQVHRVPLGDGARVELDPRARLRERAGLAPLDVVEAEESAGCLHLRVRRRGGVLPGREAPELDEGRDGRVEGGAGLPMERPGEIEHRHGRGGHGHGLTGAGPVEAGEIGLALPGGEVAVHAVEDVLGQLEGALGALPRAELEHAGPGRAHAGALDPHPSARRGRGGGCAIAGHRLLGRRAGDEEREGEGGQEASTHRVSCRGGRERGARNERRPPVDDRRPPSFVPPGLAGRAAQPPKSSRSIISGSTPRSSSIRRTAWFIIGGPQR